MPTNRGRWPMPVIFALGLMAFSLTGCVERRYTIRTDPPGAAVFVNSEYIGNTPVSKSFTFYGERNVRIIKEGYETKEIVQPIKAPWYDNLLTEFFTENLNPYTFRDEVEFSYKLDPASPAEPGPLLDRAQMTREQGQLGPVKRSTGLRALLGL